MAFSVPSNGAAWLHVIKGDIQISGASLNTGDAVAIEDDVTFVCEGTAERSELLLFAF